MQLLSILTCNSRRSLQILNRLKNINNGKRNFTSDKPAIILGIETSCDDTGCGIVDSTGKILGEGHNSQHLWHLKNGGIIPPVARDYHYQNITDVCETALRSANLRLRDVDAIATTVKPGLPMSLRVGREFGLYLSKVGNKPFIPIHHMQAHALTARMGHKVDYPFLVLLISGGHCLLAFVENVDKFNILGSTIDDSPGETFDKAARRLKMTNIPDFSRLSGGQAIEMAASRATDFLQFNFPLTMMRHRTCNFSFSGLKNVIKRHIELQEAQNKVKGSNVIPNIENLCAGFLMAITRQLCARTQRAMEFLAMRNLIPGDHTLVVSGGVACNDFIFKALGVVCSEMKYKIVRPPPKLCTDNGVMIAWNGVERWITDTGVLRDKNEIEKIDIEQKSPIGEDWSNEVLKESIHCKWVKLNFNDIQTRNCT